MICNVLTLKSLDTMLFIKWVLCRIVRIVQFKIILLSWYIKITVINDYHWLMNIIMATYIFFTSAV